MEDLKTIYNLDTKNLKKYLSGFISLIGILGIIRFMSIEKLGLTLFLLLIYLICILTLSKIKNINFYLFNIFHLSIMAMFYQNFWLELMFNISTFLCLIVFSYYLFKRFKYILLSVVLLVISSLFILKYFIDIKEYFYKIFHIICLIITPLVLFMINLDWRDNNRISKNNVLSFERNYDKLKMNKVIFNLRRFLIRYTDHIFIPIVSLIPFVIVMYSIDGIKIIKDGFSSVSYLSDKYYNIEMSKYNDGVIGAICMDGWKSSSKGSGTCSSHGGVDRWLYMKEPIFEDSKILAMQNSWID